MRSQQTGVPKIMLLKFDFLKHVQTLLVGSFVLVKMPTVKDDSYTCTSPGVMTV